MEENAARILQAVKKDNLKLFSYLAEQKKGSLSLRFGRFPVLSLCYLYDARKIVVAYEKLLIAITSYTAEEEDFESYKKFCRRAKTCMRLYRNRVVAPVEMLAVLGETYRLTTLYPKFVKDAETETNIKKIYAALYRKTPKPEGNSLYIKRNSLKPLWKAAVAIIVIFAVIMVALPAAAILNITTLTGDGSPENPFKIAGEEQLRAALPGEDLHYVLMRDITLTSDWTPDDFAGNLDGQGHTIYVGDKVKAGFINNLTGNISNLQFVISDFEVTITANIGFLFTKITGSVTDVNLTINASLMDGGVENDVYVSCFALENSGTISGCNVSAKINFGGDGQKDAFLTGLVAWNRGVVTDCAVEEGSEFITDTVDVSALVIENGETGTIEKCVNRATVTQTSNIENWSPNTAGLVLINIGNVANCTNYGEIGATSGVSTKMSEMYTGGVVAINDGTVMDSFNYGRVSASAINCKVYAGGVVSVNNGIINKCKNDAEIYCSSTNTDFYSGGITALNNTNTSLLTASCSYGHITVISDADNFFAFSGGILGYNGGTVTDSYSCMTFFDIDGESYYLGGIAGTSYYAVFQNNFYLARTYLKYGTASTLNLRFILSEGNDIGITVLSSLEQLMEQEVYWG